MSPPQNPQSGKVVIEPLEQPMISLTGKGVLAVLTAVVTIFLGMGTMLTSWVMPVFLEKADARFERALDRRMDIHGRHVHAGAATEKYVDIKIEQILVRMENLATKADFEALRATVDSIALFVRERGEKAPK